MTIAAGFKCKDGAVICSDSQETSQAGFKRSVSKIRLCPSTGAEKDKPRAIFVGSGDSVFIEEVIDQMWDAAKDCTGSLSEVARLMAEANRDYHQKIWSVYPPVYSTAQLPDADLIFAIWAQGQFDLYHMQSTQLEKVSEFITIGCGGDLANYIIDANWMHSSSKTTATRAAILAIYMLEKVKDRDEKCGGKSRVAFISSDGARELLSESQITEVPRNLAYYESLLQEILLASLDLEIQDEHIPPLIDTVQHLIMDIRKKLRQ